MGRCKFREEDCWGCEDYRYCYEQENWEDIQYEREQERKYYEEMEREYFDKIEKEYYEQIEKEMNENEIGSNSD